MKKPNIGVLALQGAVREHLNMLEECGARGIPVKHPAELPFCSGLIIPGGESTTIGKLMEGCGFLEDIRALAQEGMPLFGTCAGLIMMARRLVEGDQSLLGLMDVTVRRNAFGRQVDSFEAELVLKEIDDAPHPFHGVFIRAPWIEDTGPEVEKLGEFKGKAIMARQGNMLACAFHPELTDDTRIHSYFLEMVAESIKV